MNLTINNFSSQNISRNKSKQTSFKAVPKYRIINMEKWNGREMYDLYLTMQDPFVGLDTKVNIGNLNELAKQKGTTINTLIMYAIGKVGNLIPEARLRMVDGKLVEFEKACISPPVPAKNKKYLFNFCNIDFHSDLDTFITESKEAIKAAERRKTLFPDEFRPDAIYLSHINEHYSSAGNPTNGRYDFNPRVSWGRAEKSEMPSSFGQLILPLTIKSNHAVLAGGHAELFLRNFRNTINELNSKI